VSPPHSRASRRFHRMGIDLWECGGRVIKGVRMAIQQTEKVWHNGKLIPWDNAKLHVMSHVVNYGSSVFEGIRCYSLPSGPAIFRANEHIQRLIDSAKIYRIDVDFT